MYGRLLPNILILRIFLLEGVWSHGRMIEPPMRSSIWRFGFNSEPNYTDNELNCGGFVNQYEKNNGKCGVCGDPYQGPRDNEAGGKYARGIIVRHYSTGQIIEVTVELTANHQGYFEFRICPHDDVTHPVTQECLNRTLLTIKGHGTRYYIQNDIRQQFVHLLVQLPPDMTCTQCVLQWKYVAGNNKGSGAGYEDCYGCGPQEHFINCADVAIYSQSVPQQATIPVESVLDDSLESTSIIEYLEKMKHSNTNRMVDMDFLADFLSVDMEDDFWEDMQLFLDSSAEPLKAIVTNTAVNMFPANKDGITKFHHLVKLSLLFQGVAPPSNARKISKASINSESSKESRLDKIADNSDTSSDDDSKAIVSKDKDTRNKQGKSINLVHDKFESHDLYDSWANSVSIDSSEFLDDSSSSKSNKDKMLSDSNLSHLESQNSDSSDINESSDESYDEKRIGTRISSVDNKSQGNKRTTKVSKVKTLSYEPNAESSDDDSSDSVLDSWDEASTDTDDQSNSSGKRSKTEISDNRKDGDSGENHSDSKSNERSSDSRDNLEDSESDSNESLKDSKDKNVGQFNAMSDDSESQRKKEDNSMDSEDSWNLSKGSEGDSINSQKESKESNGRKSESKETEHQGSDTSKNINDDSNESEKTDRDKGKHSKEKDSTEKLGSNGRDEDEGKESVRGVKQNNAKDSSERETTKSKNKDDDDSKLDDRKDSKGNVVSAALSGVEVEAPEIEFKKPEAELEKLELDVEASDLKDAFGNLKDNIKLEDEKLVAAAIMSSGSEKNTMDMGKGQASISNLLAHSIVAAGPQIMSSKRGTLEDQLRSALVTVFLENHNPSLSLCKYGETKARCGCTENWTKYPLVDMYCTSLCPYGYCPTYLCQCSCPKICRGIDHLVQLTAAINQWCKSNCENGQCPSHMCICD